MLQIALAQLNPTVGDLAANVDRLAAAVAEAGSRGADLVVAPEMAITGYPPRDLLASPGFVRDSLAALGRLVAETRGPALLCGAVVSSHGDPFRAGNRMSNAAVLMHNGTLIACHRKLLLPTYDVFDEARYFVPGTAATVVSFAGVRLGLTVCEDIWNDKDYWRDPRYDRDPVAETVAAGAELIINSSASPYDRTKPAERLRMIKALARRHRRPVLYVNQVGGNDSLVFDGRCVGVDASGRVALLGPAFEESVSLARYEAGELEGELSPQPSSWEADVSAALCLGLSDYVRKCGFDRVVLGLSGGIDSAVTCALAVRALGPERVIGVAMPSRYSAVSSSDDAHALARRLGIRIDTISVEPMFQAYLAALAPAFRGLPEDVTEENLQARIRGALLMAYSNKLGALLLTTGNKSELAVGYSTLYGDMCGGLAVISDLYKTQVYAVARHLNAVMDDAIPQSSLAKPPSAELRPDQTDQDSLPPYPVLDAILEGFVDDMLSADELAAAGHDSQLVAEVLRMVQRAEYKRRQMPPGLKVSRKAFGEGRRFPIAQRYRIHTGRG